jgi:hypothetical protein
VVAADKDRGDCALRQQPDFTSNVARLTDSGSRRELCEMSFEQGFVSAREDACGMAGEIGKLDNEARGR